LKGVYIGECIRYGDWKRLFDPKQSAHAHNNEDDPMRGWICVRQRQFLVRPIMLHEIAHLLIPNQGHTEKWRRKVLAIGGTLKPVCIGRTRQMRDYQKKPRGKKTSK
jgi:hypothetical protein